MGTPYGMHHWHWVDVWGRLSVVTAGGYVWSGAPRATSLHILAVSRRWGRLFHGDTRHWLERGNGVDLCRCVALAGTGWWDWFRGACHGGIRHWLDQGDGIDLWECGVGHATRADLWGYAMGAHDWIWEMGLICGGMPLGCNTGWDTSWGRATGSGRWDWFVGARHGGATLAGCGWWYWFMGAFHGGATGSGRWNWWGRTTLARSGWGDWFMWARHEGAQHWLDWGYGIDSWGRVEWQSNIWLLNLNDNTMCLILSDTMCLMSGVEVSVQSVFG